MSDQNPDPKAAQAGGAGAADEPRNGQLDADSAAGDGFEPLPVRAVDPEELRMADERDEYDERPRMSPAQDPEIAQLLATVLDAADVANQSASTATGIADRMAQSTRKIDQSLAAGKKLGIIFLGSAGLLVMLTMVVYIVVSIQLGGRISQMDTLMLSMSKRVIELNQGMVQLAEARQQLEDFSAQQRSIATAQAELSKLLEAQKAATEAVAGSAAAAVDEVKTQMAAMVAKQAAAPAIPPAVVGQINEMLTQVKQGQQAQQAATAQFKSLEGAVRNQGRSLSTVEGKLASIDTTLAAVQAMRRELAAVLEAERRARAAAEAVPAAQRERELRELERQRFVQYPARPGTPAAADGAQNLPTVVDGVPKTVLPKSN